MRFTGHHNAFRDNHEHPSMSRQHHMMMKVEIRHDSPKHMWSRNRMFSINSARRNNSSHICNIQAKKSVASCSSILKKLSREQEQDKMKCLIVLAVCLFVGASGKDLNQ